MNLLREYVCKRYSPARWEETIADLEMDQVLTNEDLLIHQIIWAVAGRENMLEFEVMRQFGKFIAPILLSTHLAARKGASAFDIVERAEVFIHPMLRNESAPTPLLNIHRVSPSLMIVDYFSLRRMGGITLGIIQGIVAQCGENILVTTTTEPDAQRVQIKLFKK